MNEQPPTVSVGSGALVSPSVCYYTTGDGAGQPSPVTVAHTFRVGRLELCCAWLRGYMPTWFYFNPRGRLHPGAVSLTFRAYRVMLGYRWYLGANV